MLKVIAQDFIRAEAVDIVMPLYRERVELTRREPLCIGEKGTYILMDAFA